MIIGEKEVGCKICGKTVGQIFIEHIQAHLDGAETEDKITKLLTRRIIHRVIDSYNFFTVDKMALEQELFKELGI